MQPRIIHEYHVFLASPGDMDAERREVRKFFEDYNRQIASAWDVRFTVVDWENYSTIGVGRPQELITEQTLERFQGSLALVVGIMGQRFGFPTGKHESGTEEEFEWALTKNIQTGFPEIKWFFRNVETFRAPSDPQKIEDALSQWKKVRAFRERMETSAPPVYYGTFSDAAHFREVLRNDLLLWLNDAARAWRVQHEHLPDAPAMTGELPASYDRALVKDFESLDIAGIDNDRAVDIPLSEVYVRLRVIRDEDTAAADEDVDGSPIDIHAALGQFERLVIVGDPGSGKSTFLKFIALMIARAKLEDNPNLAVAKLNIQAPLPVPFFISLWDLSDFIKRSDTANENAIIDFIESRLAEKSITLERPALEAMLDAGSCCLLFDGLDEVPTERGRALISRLVESFVGRFEKNRFVVTSRVRGYTGDTILKGGFVRCDVQNFNELDRREFLGNWFAVLLGVSREHVLNEGTPSRQAFDILQSAIETKDRIRALAINPLMMTVIAIVHWNRKRLPDQRVELYDECVDVLLGQRKEAERTSLSRSTEVLNETAEEDVHYDRAWKRKRFAEIALRILETPTDEITRDVVIHLLTQRFRDRPGSSDERAAIDAERFLDREEIRSGLLVSRRSHSCRFVHLTFQEYLAAWHLAHQRLDDIKAVIASQLRNPRWFETLQLLGGELARNSDERLDEYIAYLLDNMGADITQQAPIIALCANILQDVRDVADIKAPTHIRYTQALKGTLHAFRPGSGVPAKTQLEVLGALTPLGANVKEHLVEATKSSNYQVRTQALATLITHLSDEDLFGMRHIMQDRSREPIIVYLDALFQRDAKRTLQFITSQDAYTSKAITSICILFDWHNKEMEHEEILSIATTLFEKASVEDVDEIMIGLNGWTRDWAHASETWEGNRLGLIIAGLAQKDFREYVRSSAIKFLANRYQSDDEVWAIIERRALEDLDASVRLIAIEALIKNNKASNATWEELLRQAQGKIQRSEKFHISHNRLIAVKLLIHEPKYKEIGAHIAAQIAKEHHAEWFRQDALKTLVEMYAEVDGRERSILQHIVAYGLYRDPLEPIDEKWVKYCSASLGESEAEIWQRFERLASILPLTLKR